jgi:alkyl sulfatase BDS1-like metallo-beta-lactamase superfamily hydrolase
MSISNNKIVFALALSVLVPLCCAGCSAEKNPVVPGSRALELSELSKEFRPEIIRVTDGVYAAVGYGLANSIMLIGSQSVVIVDTMEGESSAEVVAKEFKKITKRPVSDIIYTHNHADHVFGARAFAGKNRVNVYSHAMTLTELDRFTTITREITYVRAMRMFGTLLPKELHINSGIGPRLTFSRESKFSLLRPNKTFPGKKMKLKIPGLTLELIHAPGETDDQIVVWLPGKKVLIAADNFYKSFPNLYTIRGTRYRDVLVWAKSLIEMRDLGAEYLVPCHSRPLKGKANIYRVLTDYADAIKYVHDQTVREINRGLMPDEIVEKVRLPGRLAGKPYLKEYYGTVAWSVRNVFNGYLGWFSGNASDINPLPPHEKARRFAELAGGTAGLLDKTKKSFKEKDYQWVLTMCDQLLALDPEMAEATRMKSSSLKALAADQGNANARNYYYTQALELDGKLKISVPPVSADTVSWIPLEAIFEGMTVRLNPVKSEGIEKSVAFDFPDTGQSFTVEVRRGVAWVVPAKKKSALTVTVNSRVWKEIAAKVRNPALALARGEMVVEGGIVNLVKFLFLFQD